MNHLATPSTSSTDYDPVSVTIFAKALENIAQEMAAVVVRSSGSPVIAEAVDFAICLLDAEGEVISYGGYIVSYIGTARRAVRHLLDTVPAERIRPGDAFICNDPFTTGSAHTVDVAIVRPVFVDDEIVAWCWAFAHLFDFGGVAAGGFAPMATEAYAEGLRLPGVKIVDQGVVVDDVWRLITTNIRVSQLVLNDIRCLIACCNRGNDRLLDLVSEHGLDTFHRYSVTSRDLVEQAARERIRALPDGTYSVDEYVEHSGHQPQLLNIHCDVVVADDEITMDFSRSAPQSDGFVNCAAAVTTGFAVTPLFVSLFCDLPINEGALRPITVITAPGTICDVTLPAPVSSGHMETGLKIGKLVSGLLADLQARSEDPFVQAHIMAPWHDSFSGSIFYAPDEHGTLTPFFDMNGGGAGGGAQAIAEGMDVGGCLSQTMNTIPDIEINESDYPVLYLWRKLNRNSGGLGLMRGGDGIELAWTPHYTTGGSQNVFTACTEVPPAGVFGGYPGSASGFRLVRNTGIWNGFAQGDVPRGLDDLQGEVVELDAKQFGLALAPEDVLQMHVGGGSGYGDPLARTPAAVASDVRAGIISEKMAREGYGVVLTAGDPDASATDALRAELLSGRTEWEQERLPDDGVLGGRRLAVRRSVASSRLATFDQWVHHNPLVHLVEYADPDSGELLRTELVVDRQQHVVPQGSAE